MAPTREDVTIRRFDPRTDSIAELTELLHRAYRELLDMGLRYVATGQSEETTRKRIEGAECYVGVVDGRLAATITFRDASRSGGAPWYDRSDVATFHQMCVDTHLRGLGIGARLMDLAEGRARETGAAEIALDTAEEAGHLVALYERRGYRIVERVRWPMVNFGSVILSKTVSTAVPRETPGAM